LTFVPSHFHALSGFKRLVLRVGEALGSIVLLIDKLVSITGRSALELGPVVKYPVK
jgi:hypothetical protein